MYYISFITNIVRTSKQQYHFNRCRFSCTWKWSVIVCVIFCITTITGLQSYIVSIDLFQIISCSFSLTLSFIHLGFVYILPAFSDTYAFQTWYALAKNPYHFISIPLYHIHICPSPPQNSWWAMQERNPKIPWSRLAHDLRYGGDNSAEEISCDENFLWGGVQ